MSSIRSIPISEVRRRLPELVQSVWRSGERIDVTHRGEVRASIVRAKRKTQLAAVPSALRVEIVGNPANLPAVVRELRTRAGKPRSVPPRGRQSR